MTSRPGMPCHERSSSQDRELVLRYQSVPMWDSSDPERAPPPLPMNPGSTSPKTKSNVSPHIQAVAANFTEKPRDNAPCPYTTNPMPSKPSSPERSLIKGHYHRRMQSLQNTDPRSEFLSYFESISPEKQQPERSQLEKSALEQVQYNETKQQDKSQEKPDGSSSSMQDAKDFSNYYISNRYLSKPILGEGTPPSATMLALQNMQIPSEAESPPPSNPSSNSGSQSGKSHNFDSLASQIRCLTDIASSLQREMFQLSRRSKDNATDLLSLKAATSSRDEDIRKTLRELSSSLSSRLMDNDSSSRWDSSSILGSVDHINPRELDSSASSRKGCSVPRTSGHSGCAVAIDRELCGSPAAISDGSASIALLEKVLREMATKEGQDELVGLISQANQKSTGDSTGEPVDSSTIKLLKEILDLMKERSGSHALKQSIDSHNVTDVSSHSPADSEVTLSRSLDMEKANSPSMCIAYGDSDQTPGHGHSALQAGSSAIDEVLSILKGVRSSVVEGGGMTNEVKALVRELRGEVLGMGRDLARQLEDADASRSSSENRQTPPATEDISVIIDNALQGLKEQLLTVVAESQQSLSTLSDLRDTLSGSKIYSIVKEALNEFELPEPQPGESRDVGLQRDEILKTVREAWETYKPEIELSNFGLDREEILECLAEGLKSYQPQHEQAATYDQVLAAVQAGMQNFDYPPAITADGIIKSIHDAFEAQRLDITKSIHDEYLGPIRDEILQAVTKGIESQSSLTRETLDSGLGRDEILGAVSDGVEAHFAAVKGIEQPSITKEDVINAVNDAFAVQALALTAEVQPPALRDDILGAIAEGIENQAALGREIELNKDDLMDIISSSLHEAAGSINFGLDEPAMEYLQGLLDDMKEEFKQHSAASGKDAEQILDAIRNGFGDVQRGLESFVTAASDVAGKHEPLDTVRERFGLFQADMEKAIMEGLSNAARSNPNTPELLDAMEKEFEYLRQTLSSVLIRNDTSNEKAEILDAIRDITENQAKAPDGENIVSAIKEELEHLRQSMDMRLVPAELANDKEDIITALRESLEAFRDEGSHQKGSDENTLPTAGALLDAFNAAIGTVREDLAKLMEKPIGIDSAEELQFIREGLGGLKADMELLRQFFGYDEPGETRGAEIVLAGESNGPRGIGSLRNLMAELRAKIESLETAREAETSSDPPKEEHLNEILANLNDIKDSISDSMAHGISVHETAARREDTDAIEALVQDTKAQLEGFAKEEHITALEKIIKEANDSIADLSSRVETEGPTKSEIGTLETLLKDMWTVLDELNRKKDENDDAAEKLTKADLQIVEAMIFEVKTQIDELKLPDAETLPTKADIEELSALVVDFREKVEIENEMAGQGLEARKVEHAGIADEIEEIKKVIGDIGGELRSKLEDSSENSTELKQVLKDLMMSTENFTTVENVKDLTELISREFERARGEQEANKLEMEEQHTAAITKHDESRAAIIVELGSRIDEKFNQVVSRYDEAQTAMSSMFSEAEGRGSASLEAVTDTKAIAEDIKLVLGAMGNSVNETCERISVETKAFSEKVDESCSKIEEIQSKIKSHQEQSRTDLVKTAAATDRVESKLQIFHPQILESVQEILSIVGQHYDHSQSSTRELQAGLSALPSIIPPLLPALPPPEQPKYDDSEVHKKLDDLLEHTKSDHVQKDLNTILERVTNDQVHEKLDQLLSCSACSNTQVYEKLDELLNQSAGASNLVHEKLDTLLGHVTNSDQLVTQMMKLDEMHKDIMESSHKMNEILNAQTSRIDEDNERRRKESEEIAITLERRMAERELVEAEITGLNKERGSLLRSIEQLKLEKEDIVKQNTRLSKELSGLEMALDLRHEELQVMEGRADSLEKRILEGVLDHARTVLLGRSNGPQAMNLKRSVTPRIRKPSSTNITSATRGQHNIIRSGVGMALKRRTAVPASSQTGSAPVPGAGTERRILSMSHVTNNRGAGPRQASVNSGRVGIKRSHSAKPRASQRQASLGTGRTDAENKENEVYPEVEETQSEYDSDVATERRASHGSTLTGSVIYSTASAVSTERRPSIGSSTSEESPGTHPISGANVTSYDPYSDSVDGFGEDRTSAYEEDDQTTTVDSDSDDLVDDTNDDAADKKLVVYECRDSGLGPE